MLFLSIIVKKSTNVLSGYGLFFNFVLDALVAIVVQPQMLAGFSTRNCAILLKG